MPLEVTKNILTDSYCKIDFRLCLAFHFNCYWLSRYWFYTLSSSFSQTLNTCLQLLHVFLATWRVSVRLGVEILGYNSYNEVCCTGRSLLLWRCESYLPILFVLTNQSCWLIDMTLITAEDIQLKIWIFFLSNMWFDFCKTSIRGKVTRLISQNIISKNIILYKWNKEKCYGTSISLLNLKFEHYLKGLTN